MEPIISTAKIVGMIVSTVLSIGTPIALCIYWHKRTGAKWISAFVGAITFYVFVSILEGSMHAYCLGLTQENAVSRFLNSTPWAYVLYGGFAAGIFEETGRFLAFKWVLKKQRTREAGVMYGIGHGGIEAILVGGISMIMNLAFSLNLNQLGIDGMLAANSANAASVQSTIESMTASNPSIFYVSGIERLIAIMLHISLSILVFVAAKRKGKFYLYPVAILLHAAVDCFAVLYHFSIISNIFVIELVVLAMTVLVAWYACRLYRNDKTADAPAVDPAIPKEA